MRRDVGDRYEVVAFPRMRQLVVDAGRVGRRRHIIHGLIEVDVTRARETLRNHRARTGGPVSLTAFLTACVARAVDGDRQMHAYRSWRNRLVIFEDVDVLSMIEIEIDGKKVPVFHIIRAANRKSPPEIDQEIRDVQHDPDACQGLKLMQRFPALPWFLRMLVCRMIGRSPHLLRRHVGTVAITAVGMYGAGSGWGIGVGSYHTLGVVLGGIAERPGVVGGEIEVREYLSMTLSVDHDIVDGAPAARFAHRLKRLIEEGYVPDEGRETSGEA